MISLRTYFVSDGELVFRDTRTIYSLPTFVMERKRPLGVLAESYRRRRLAPTRVRKYSRPQTINIGQFYVHKTASVVVSEEGSGVEEGGSGGGEWDFYDDHHNPYDDFEFVPQSGLYRRGGYTVSESTLANERSEYNRLHTLRRVKPKYSKYDYAG